MRQFKVGDGRSFQGIPYKMLDATHGTNRNGGYTKKALQSKCRQVDQWSRCQQRLRQQHRRFQKDMIPEKGRHQVHKRNRTCGMKEKHWDQGLSVVRRIMKYCKLSNVESLKVLLRRHDSVQFRQSLKHCLCYMQCKSGRAAWLAPGKENTNTGWQLEKQQGFYVRTSGKRKRTREECKKGRNIQTPPQQPCMSEMISGKGADETHCAVWPSSSKWSEEHRQGKEADAGGKMGKGWDQGP